MFYSLAASEPQVAEIHSRKKSCSRRGRVYNYPDGVVQWIKSYGAASQKTPSAMAVCKISFRSGTESHIGSGETLIYERRAES